MGNKVSRGAGASTASTAVSTRLIDLCASVFGLGYLPWAPGTWGTLAALPLYWYVMAAWSLPAYIALSLLVTGVGIALAAAAERAHGAHDAQYIVIDEVAGMLWTMVAVPKGPLWLLAGFVLFRILDATKPGPIGWLDRQVGGGLGVVMDDVLAGLCGCALLHAASFCLS